MLSELKNNPKVVGAKQVRRSLKEGGALRVFIAGDADPQLTDSPDQEAAYPVTIDGEDYLQQVFTVESPTWVDGLTVNVSFQDGADVPAGTRIVDENNQDITQVKVSGTGTRYN